MRIDIRVENPHAGYWFAYDDLTYDVDYVEGAYVNTTPTGSGKTKWEAIRDLIDAMEDEDE